MLWGTAQVTLLIAALGQSSVPSLHGDRTERSSCSNDTEPLLNLAIVLADLVTLHDAPCDRLGWKG